MNITLAARVQRIAPSATVGMTARALALKAEGRDIISLSVGEPDFPTPAHVCEAAIAALRAGATKYTALEGTRELKAAIRRKFARENGLDYAPEQILVSNGAKQACFNLCLALLDKGDEAIIPAPYWVSYPDMVRLADAEPVFVPTTAESGFLMTPEALEAAITPRTRLLIMNSPSNPTGGTYSRGALAALGKVLARNPRIVVLSDEIYEHIQWTGAPYASFAAACPALHSRTVTVNGMSKAYAMSGWRLGYAAGPREIIRAMATIQSQSTTNASSISQAASVAALDGDQESVRRMCREFRERHDVLQPLLDAVPGVRCPRVSGAFYFFADARELVRGKGLRDDVDLCEQLLEKAGVAIVPGGAFGAPGFVRISFAASLDLLLTAIERIDAFARA